MNEIKEGSRPWGEIEEKSNEIHKMRKKANGEEFYTGERKIEKD